jgi:hypothetical protein
MTAFFTSNSKEFRTPFSGEGSKIDDLRNVQMKERKESGDRPPHSKDAPKMLSFRGSVY